MAAFIAAQRANHDVPHATSCRALGVSQGWFYKWRHGDPSPRHARREQLGVKVDQLFAKHRGRSGSPRITADLHDEGWRVSVNSVAAVMREQGLVARPPRRRRSTTRRGKGTWKAPDLVKRDFAADGLNEKWYGDGTEIVTDEGKLYLDSVLDMGSRRVIGHALGEHHDTDLAYGSLAMAVAVRGGKEQVDGVIMHTDQGSKGGFKWSSQHLDDGGVLWRRGRCGRGRVRVARPVADGSGRRIVRCGRRCARRDGRSRRVRCSGRSGG